MGRPQTGITSTNNFKTKVLKAYDIEHQRVYGHPWYLFKMPQRDNVQKRLQSNKVLSLAKLDIYSPPYTHIVLFDDTEPSVIKQELTKKTIREVLPYHLQSEQLPLWWTNAKSWLRKREITYKELNRHTGSLKEALTETGVEYPHDDDPYGRWIILLVPKSTKVHDSIEVSATDIITWCKLPGIIQAPHAIAQQTPVIKDARELVGIVQLQDWSHTATPDDYKRVLSAMNYIIKVEGMPACKLTEGDAESFLRVIQEVVVDKKEIAVLYYLRKLTASKIVEDNNSGPLSGNTEVVVQEQTVIETTTGDDLITDKE